MNDSHRSDRNWQPFARTPFVACVPAHQGRTERKVLRNDWIGAFLAIFCGFAAVGILAGCSSGAAKSGLQTTQTPLISVALTQGPPYSMIAGNSVNVAAAVTNDPASAGVDWVLTCPVTANIAPPCGTVTPSHTASGAAAIYTAPPGIPSKNKVTVTALSTTDRSKSSAATVTITSTVTGIAITTPLPGVVPALAVLNFGATVYGDPANLGTDWTVTCPVPSGPVDCGDLHSDARGTVAYTVPQMIIDPVTQQGVSLEGSAITITAYATADHTKYAPFGPVSVTAPISISITEPPPATMLTGATAPVIAKVSNDSTNSGVTWLLSCSQSACGSITPTQTASGATATYTAPSTVPSPNPAPGLTVSIAAFANATGSVNNPTTTLHDITTVNIVAPISVSITQNIKNSTIIANTKASLVATVSNDYSNAGVDWTVSCGSAGACGTFSPAHTASGATTTYTAPSAPPTPNTITITATSTADTTKSDQQQNVTVTAARPPLSLLQGQFVLYLSAKNSQNGPFIFGGVISGDGNGTVTSGSFAVAIATGNDAAGNGNSVGSTQFRSAAASPYSIGLDGRGQITLTLGTGAAGLTSFGVPVPGTANSTLTSTLTLSVVFVTPQHALLTEIDSFGDATGTLDLQNATDLASFSGLNGTYSLQLSGTQVATGYPGFFVAAAITSQFSSSAFQTTFTGYTADQSTNGAITSAPFTVGTPGQSFFSFLSHQTGEIQFNSVNLSPLRSLSLDLWLIDANHFVVTDFVDRQSGLVVGGYLTAQPSAPSLSGTLAFTEAGATTTGATAPGQPQVAGGIVTCASTGSVDVVSLGATPVTNPAAVSATCSAPSNGRGSITITGAGISRFAAYPTVDQSFYLIELDGGSAGTSGPSGAGVAYPQTLSTPISASALSGNYGSQFSASTQLGSQAFTGQLISDASASAAISGTADVNSFNTSTSSGSPSTGATLSGSYTAATDGRFPLTFTITPATNQPTPQISTLNPACYIVDANTCLLLGLDATAPGTGILQLQTGLGL